jgi:hypothetical protein
VIREKCVKNLQDFAGSFVRDALRWGDEHCARNYGVMVIDFARSGTKEYGAVRRKLEKSVKVGELIAYRSGTARVRYWPVGLADELLRD